VAQRGEAGVAQEHVEAHGQDADDQGLGQQRQRVGGQERGDHGQDHDRRRGQERAAADHERPKRPVGRNARISAIGAKSVK